MANVARKAVNATLKGTINDPLHYMPIIEQYVIDVQRLTQTAYFFVKYVFIKEADLDTQGLLSSGLTAEFFVECLLALNNSKSLPSSARCKERTAAYRELICTHLPSFRQIYMPACSLNHINNPQQTCLYQGRAMVTAYINNIENHLCDQLRRAVNIALHRREKERSIRREFHGENRSRLIAQLRSKCNRMKRFILWGSATDFDDFEECEMLECATLWSITAAFHVDGLTNLENSIQMHPEGYMRLSIFLNRWIEERAERCFISTPLRLSCIPCSTQIDTKIIVQQILKQSIKQDTFQKKERYGVTW
jgi:hypothetical protein